MHRIALIYSQNPSDWVSCQKIVKNLAQAYHLIDGSTVVDIEYTQDMSEYAVAQSIKALANFNPSHVVCIDHKPHPLPLLEGYFSQLKDLNTKFIFHTFGDFSLNLKKWHNLEKQFTERSVLFYGASQRQTSLLSEFIDPSNLATCPFPISENEFKFSSIIRDNTRNRYEWQEDKVFLFTGRLSRQKQTKELVSTFAAWLEKSNAKARLILVGDFDEVGDPYTDRGEWIGEYLHETMDFHESLPQEIKQRIEFHGFKTNSELHDYYCAADSFVNISVHNDEDYGMSCAEALSCGLPMILTDWAGFSSFAFSGLEEFVSFVPVELILNGRVTDFKTLTAAFSKTLNQNFLDRRSWISQQSLQATGINAISNKVRQHLDDSSRFKTFSDFLKLAAERESHYNGNTFYNHRARRYNDIYMRMYRHYVRNT